MLEGFLWTRCSVAVALAVALLLMAINQLACQHASRRLSGGIALTDARIQAAQTLHLLTDAEPAVRLHPFAGQVDRNAAETTLQLYRQALVRLPAVQDRPFAVLRKVDRSGVRRSNAAASAGEQQSALQAIVDVADTAPAPALPAAATDARQ